MLRNIISILIVAAFAFGLTGCCASQSPHAPAAAPMPPVITASAGNDLLIISAAYGSGVNFADVTARVNSLMHQPNAVFYARPEWLNADPTPGWNKALVIEYEYRGQRQIFTTGEGGKVSAEELIARATLHKTRHPKHRKKH